MDSTADEHTWCQSGVKLCTSKGVEIIFSVHDNKFVKPKQYVWLRLVFAVFRPRFRKLLSLALSEMCFACRVEILSRQQ